MKLTKLLNENSLSNEESVKHLKRFLVEIKTLKKKYYNIFGDSSVFDGLDLSSDTAQEMINYFISREKNR